MVTDLISATLIYDGAGDPLVPPQMLPDPRDEKTPQQIIAGGQQLVGTPLEQLCELAGRVCYSSLGAEKSRSSAGYHQHILDVKHLSTVEHANFTLEWSLSTPTELFAAALPFLNRPSLFVRPLEAAGNHRLRVTMNLRHVLEWDSFSRRPGPGAAIRKIAHGLAPQIVTDVSGPTDSARLVVPETDDEKWVTMLLTGSRGFSHELVRHGDWTAISQRSTRYVDESESPWVEHPLLTARFEDSIKSFATIDPDTRGQLRRKIVVDAQARYKGAVESLEPWLIARGVDKVSARKQARGAARGYLGNALYTEVVFSANLSQWRRMLRQRLNAAADAEIRQCFAGVLRELQRCRYADRFTGWTTAPSPDGIGEVLVEPT